MIKYQEILEMPLFFSKEGKEGEDIKGVLVNSKKFTVEGFLIAGGMKKFLPFEKVQSFGSEAVVTETESDVIEVPENKDAIPGKDVIDLMIITKNGKLMGKVTSFFFEKETGKLTHYQVTEGVIKDIADGRGVMPQDAVEVIGEDAVIVKDTVVDIVQAMKTNGGLNHFLTKTAGGLKKIGSDAKEGAEKGLKSAGESVKKSAGSLKEQIGKKAGSIKEFFVKDSKKTAEDMNKAKEFIKDDAKKTAEDLDKAVHVVEETVNKASDIMGDAKKATGKKTEEVKEEISKKAAEAGKNIEKVKERTEKATEEIKEKLSHKEDK